MKLLPAVISAAAGLEVADNAWTKVAAAYNEVYDDIFAAYVGKGLPARNARKKANRLRDFYNKVENFPTRVSDSCVDFAGSGDPDAFIPPYYDSEDVCHSINNLIASVKSFHDAFVCMDDVNLTTDNGWAPHKMIYTIQRQRSMLFNRKFKQLKCNLLSPTPPPCETNPCDGLDDCHILVDGCSLQPSRNNQIGTVPAALNYKFSADVLCDQSMALDGGFKNIFHVSAGENFGAANDRTFALWRYPSENKLYFTVNDPAGDDHSKGNDYVCTDGEWNTYSVEVKQVDSSPKNLRYTVSVDGVQIDEGTYNYQSSVTSGDLQVFVSDDWYDAGSAFAVRNFYYQTFADTPLCSDPCDGIESCTTLVNGCEIAPTANNQVGTVQATLAYKASAEVFCSHEKAVSASNQTILRLGAGPDIGAPGDRTFLLMRNANGNGIHVVVNFPGDWSHQRYVIHDCIENEWNTYAVEVTVLEGSTLSYVATVDGVTVMDGTYDWSGAKTTGDLTAFVAGQYNEPATGFNVRNFFYQILDATPACAVDPCDGVENCFSFVDGCAIAPIQNNVLETVPAAVSYKASAEVFCDHSAPLNSEYTAILRLGAGRANHGGPGDRTFLLMREPNGNRIHFVVNDPIDTYAHQRYSDVTCTDGEWSTYTIEVIEDGNGQLNYVASVDGASELTGSYDLSGAKTTGDLYAYVADNYQVGAASAFKVRNFYYQIL